MKTPITSLFLGLTFMLSSCAQLGGNPGEIDPSQYVPYTRSSIQDINNPAHEINQWNQDNCADQGGDRNNNGICDDVEFANGFNLCETQPNLPECICERSPESDQCKDNGGKPFEWLKKSLALVAAVVMKACLSDGGSQGLLPAVNCGLGFSGIFGNGMADGTYNHHAGQKIGLIIRQQTDPGSVKLSITRQLKIYVRGTTTHPEGIRLGLRKFGNKVRYCYPLTYVEDPSVGGRDLSAGKVGIRLEATYANEMSYLKDDQLDQLCQTAATSSSESKFFIGLELYKKNNTDVSTYLVSTIDPADLYPLVKFTKGDRAASTLVNFDHQGNNRSLNFKLGIGDSTGQTFTPTNPNEITNDINSRLGETNNTADFYRTALFLGSFGGSVVREYQGLADTP